jgi:hypothetical protein
MHGRLAAPFILLALALPPAWADDTVMQVSATILGRCGLTPANTVRCANTAEGVTYRVSHESPRMSTTSAPAALQRGTARIVKAAAGDVVTIEL